MRKSYLIIFFLSVFFVERCYPQANVVLNGAFINISNSAFLVVDNPATDAIVRVSGHIISEGENNRVQWNIGTATGTYIVPFGYETSDYIPVSLTKSSGSGSGSFIVSTYRTGSWLNSAYMPAGVMHLNNLSGIDNSQFVLDRFWQIDANGYTTKPDISNLIFTYIDAEFNVPSNTIIEPSLQAQRWNSTLGKWGDWGPIGTGSTSLNTVTVSNVASADFFKWWTLVDKISPLPIVLTDLSAFCNEGTIELNWSTSSETNNSHFTVERSQDLIHFSSIALINGAGNSTQVNKYQFTDESKYAGVNYFRLKQTDFDGNFNYSPIISANCDPDKQDFLIFPNPAIDKVFISSFNKKSLVSIFDLQGKEMITSVSVDENEQVIDISSLSQGIYLLQLASGNSSQYFKLVKQ